MSEILRRDSLDLYCILRSTDEVSTDEVGQRSEGRIVFSGVRLWLCLFVCLSTW